MEAPTNPTNKVTTMYGKYSTREQTQHLRLVVTRLPAGIPMDIPIMIIAEFLPGPGNENVTLELNGEWNAYSHRLRVTGGKVSDSWFGGFDYTFTLSASADPSGNSIAGVFESTSKEFQDGTFTVEKIDPREASDFVTLRLGDKTTIKIGGL